MTYRVWIGGCISVEGVSYQHAKEVYQEWIDDGYDDAVIEEEQDNSYSFGDYNPSVSVRNYRGRGGHETWGSQR